MYERIKDMFYGLMVFIATFNSISVISWHLVLYVEERGVPVENHRPVASYRQTLSYNAVSSSSRHKLGRTHNVSDDKSTQVVVNPSIIRSQQYRYLPHNW
jgi:predicted Zn-dependent protease